MSKIQAELCSAANYQPKRGAGRQDTLAAIVEKVAELSDKQWDALSDKAQDWFNDAVDAKNAKKKDLPDFPDAELEPEPEAPARRGRAAPVAESATPGTVAVTTPKVGMPLKVTTKRGKEISGTVVELDADVIVLKLGNGDEEEFDLGRIEKMETLAGQDDEEELADPIKVGLVVHLTTKRGKSYTGKIVELDADTVVLDVDGKDEEFNRDRVESIKPADVAGKAKRSAPAEPETPAKTARATNEGVSIGTRIKELIADDTSATEEQIGKLLKKEGLDYKDGTLKLNYADAHKFIAILREKKLLK
jgi:ribosome maturation factor RimP